MRKPLSNHRTLALSYIFLLSGSSKILSKFSADKKALIMDKSTVLTCHKMSIILQQGSINEEEANREIDKIRMSCEDHDAIVATRIVASLLHKFLSLTKNKDNESNLIVETLRPFIVNCIISRCKDVKFEWMTYRLVSYIKDRGLMIPDLVLYLNPLSTINFELLMIEVKKHGNFGNGNLEKDLVKLGKEMQLALDKLAIFKVKDPVVVGLLVEGIEITSYKMDLKYNGQYRMIEMGQFYAVRDNLVDVMLVPSIIQRMNQVQQIIEEMSIKVFKAINGQEYGQDVTTCMRTPCSSPVIISKENKKKRSS
ncbi:hypothetical protein CLU79DRAFT_782039 [Phycomyces nitens]|nr:hypothetical protein CLU79DRAFT_782039 [Phycomyces nitens]